MVASISHLNLDLIFSTEGVVAIMFAFFIPRLARARVRFSTARQQSGTRTTSPYACWRGPTARRVESQPQTAAKAIGGRLFDAVFTGQVLACFQTSQALAHQQNTGLRLRLRFQDCPELTDVPWELLYNRREDSFLTLSAYLPIVRYVESDQPVLPLALEPPLRVLVVVSSPTDYPALDSNAELSKVASAVADLVKSGQLSLITLTGAQATFEGLQNTLLDPTFNVLHFVGHGGFDPQNGGSLVFVDEFGRGRPIYANDLGVVLGDCRRLRLVILNACEGARSDPTDPFAGVADTLVRRQIPAVVAMQFEVSDQAAIRFASGFYRALAAGYPVDAATTEGRKRMKTISAVEWATPVLHMRGETAQLFTVSPLPNSRPADFEVGLEALFQESQPDVISDPQTAVPESPHRPTPILKSLNRRGAYYDGEGTQFGLYSEAANRVQLCLVDEAGHEEQYDLTELDYNLWGGYFRDIAPGQQYGFRVHGPYEPAAGHRFNPAKLLLIRTPRRSRVPSSGALKSSGMIWTTPASPVSAIRRPQC